MSNVVPLFKPEQFTWPSSIPVEICADSCEKAFLVHAAENGAVYKTDCNRTFIMDANGIREECY